MLQPTIELFGLRVQEPVTTLTDLIVAVVSFYAFFSLNRSERNDRSFTFFKYFFLTMGISTTLGGLIGHAFLSYFGFAWKIPGWITGMCSIALMERAAITHARPLLRSAVGSFFGWMNIIELLTFMFIAFYTLNFSFVEIHAAYGLIIVFLFECFIYTKKKDAGSKLIIIGVGVASLAAVVHISKFSLHTWFNYFDLSHVFMATSSYLFFLGVKGKSFTMHLKKKSIDLKEKGVII